MEKRNVVPIHKSDYKQRLKNYHPMSLLPISGKMFEKIIFNELFKFFIENELIHLTNWDLKPGAPA